MSGLSPRNSHLIDLSQAGAKVHCDVPLQVILIYSQGWNPPSLQELGDCQLKKKVKNNLTIKDNIKNDLKYNNSHKIVPGKHLG